MEIQGIPAPILDPAPEGYFFAINPDSHFLDCSLGGERHCYLNNMFSFL